MKNNNCPCVSLIMPAYNAESFLCYSVESIIKQSFDDWELIIINDGSKDLTCIIADEFAEKDSRIRVIHQYNSGVSASRQKGVDLAQGEYITHVDADDWLEPNALELMYKKAKAENADLVWCDVFLNKDQVWRMPCEESAPVMISKILKQEVWGTLWNRMIRREICQNQDVVFPKSCTMWEDMSFVVQVLSFCKKIAYVNKPLYHYVQVNPDSLVHSFEKKEVSVEYQKAINEIVRLFEEKGIKDVYIKELREIQLFAVRNYIDDKRFINYEKFMNTYPDAIEHISDYPKYPNRLKIAAWLLRSNLSLFIPIVCKVDALFRKLNITRPF